MLTLVLIVTSLVPDALNWATSLVVGSFPPDQLAAVLQLLPEPPIHETTAAGHQ